MLNKYKAETYACGLFNSCITYYSENNSLQDLAEKPLYSFFISLSLWSAQTYARTNRELSSSSNAADIYSKSNRFSSRPGHRLSLLTF
jgi:hypothetical protein